eukprot:7613568-Pyramimonas_sp.AAC.2
MAWAELKRVHEGAYGCIRACGGTHGMGGAEKVAKGCDRVHAWLNGADRGASGSLRVHVGLSGADRGA